MRTTPQRNLIIIILLAALCGLSAFPKAGTAAPLMEPVNPGTTNLEAWWSLDEASGTRNDSHGSNHLTDNNTVGNTAGKVGNAAQFTKSNSEYLSISDNASLSSSDLDFAFGGWVYFSSLTGATGVLGKVTSSAANSEYAIDVDGTNLRVYQYYANGTAAKVLSYGTVSTSTWYFIVAWHDATSDTLNIQVNNGTPLSTAYTNGFQNSTAPFNLGQAQSSAGFMNGYQDEFFFYRRLLSSDEREWLYNSGNGRTYCDLEGACSTPTPTASNTSTPTITFTPSNTPTATFTPSNTPTFTNTVPGVTDTFTPTITFTPSDTPTITFTPSITSTPTITFTPSITPTPGEFATAFWDGEITYGDAANVTVLSLLCLIMVVGLMAWFVTTYLQRKRKS